MIDYGLTYDTEKFVTEITIPEKKIKIFVLPIDKVGKLWYYTPNLINEWEVSKMKNFSSMLFVMCICEYTSFIVPSDSDNL